MSKIISLILFVFIHCSTSFAEEPAAWKIDDKYLTPKCFIYEWMSSDNFEEFFNRYVSENKKWEDWWNNIGEYYGKQIPLEDSFEASWGKDTLSLTRYLKDCTSPEPVTKDEVKLLSYSIVDVTPEESCKSLAPNIIAKCLDLKVVNVVESFPAMSSEVHTSIYGIFELMGKNKIILPLKMNYLMKKKTETKVQTKAEIEKISLSNFEWIKNQTKLSNTNQLIFEDRFLKLLEYNISSQSLYLGLGKGKKTLFKNLRVVLGGPPDKIEYLSNRRYVVANACRGHSCPEKGLVFIDTERKEVAGVIRHFFIHDLKMSGEGDFLIFSKNHKTLNGLSDMFFKVVKEWIKEKKISPTKVRFIGSDDSINDVTKKFLNK